MSAGSKRAEPGLAPMEQLIAFVDFERKHNPETTHIAEWALTEIERLNAIVAGLQGTDILAESARPERAMSERPAGAYLIHADSLTDREVLQICDWGDPMQRFLGRRIKRLVDMIETGHAQAVAP